MTERTHMHRWAALAVVLAGTLMVVPDFFAAVNGG
jgi:hypothetical protein